MKNFVGVVLCAGGMCLLLVATEISGSAAQECGSKQVGPSLRISVTSLRNATGHWIVEASATHRRGEASTDSNLEVRRWKYDIDFKRIDCGTQESLQMLVTAIAPPKKPGSDYTLFPGIGYYKLHTEKAVWEEAKLACEKEGAHLAILNSDEEEAVLKELISTHSKDKAWVHVGFHDRFKQGEYVTVLGEPLSSTGFTRWRTGEPSGKAAGKEEDCGCIHSDGGLNDIYCDFKGMFLCEHQLW